MKFTKQQLLDLSPCRDGLEFAESYGFDFAKIYETCHRGDWLIWLLRKSKAIDEPQAVLIACERAERVLAIYEKKNPKDLRPRQAIEAAREWAKNPTQENSTKCSAYAAAYAATYTYAYAYADADAAYAAAYAATYAAAYAYADAAADAAAYAAAKNAEMKWQADKIRELVPNPFREGKAVQS
jgi:hypothetical protein